MNIIIALFLLFVDIVVLCLWKVDLFIDKELKEEEEKNVRDNRTNSY